MHSRVYASDSQGSQAVALHADIANHGADGLQEDKEDSTLLTGSCFENECR